MSQAKKKALVIGVSHYNNLQPLDLCKNDAEELLRVLSEQRYEIPENRRLIGEVPYETMRKAINGFFSDSSNGREDTLIFYFSGHGLPDGHGKHYLAPSDIDPNDPFDKGLDFENLEYLINKKCNSDRIIAILDCCFSGAAGLEGAKGEDDVSIAKQVNFRAIFQGVIRKFQGKNSRNLAVLLPPAFPKDKKAQVQKYLDHYTGNMYNTHVYWGDALEFAAELRKRLDEFRSKKMESLY